MISNGTGSSGVTLNIASGTDTFGGSIQGNLYLIKAGAGTLRLTGANTNSSTGVSEGILEIGQGGSTLNVDVGGGVLSFNRPDSFTRSSDTSGSGSVTILGGGNMTLTGTFNHNGGTNVASGQILTLGNGGSIGGAGVLTVDGSLKVNNSSSASIGAVIGGLGSLSVDAGALVLTGSNVYQGATTVASGATLQVGNAGTVGALPPSAVVTNNGTLVISRSGSLTFANSVNGAGDFVSRMAAGGTLTLSGSNAFTGITRIENGTLVIGGAAALAGSNSVVLGSAGNSATLELNGLSKSFASLATEGVAANQVVRNSAVGIATLNFTAAGTVSFGGAFVEASANSKIGIGYSGGGTLAFGSTNTYTGGTVITNGTARLGATNAFSVGALTLGGAATVGILDLGGFNQTVSALTVGVGGVAASQLIGNSSTTADSVFTYAGGAVTLGVVIQDVLGSGTRKTGLNLTTAGTVTLVGANTYTGQTTIGATTTAQVGAFAADGAIGRGLIDNAGTLLFARTDTYVMPVGNIVTGNGAVVLGSIGSIVVSSASQFDTDGALIFGRIAGDTVQSSLDLALGGANFGSLIVRNRSNAGQDNVITVGTGQTLRVNGAVTVGYNSGATTVTRLKMAGGGAFMIGSVGNSALINVQVGGSVTDAVTNNALMDLRGLASFYAGLAGGTFRVGDLTNSGGGSGGSGASGGSNVYLAPVSTIVANTVAMDSPVNTVNQRIFLGSTSNVFNVNTFTVSGNRSGGLVTWDPLTTTGTLTIRNRAGTGRTAINLGWMSSTTGATPDAIMNLRGHSVDILAGNFFIAARTGASGASNLGEFIMSAGTVDITDLRVADRRVTSNNSVDDQVTGTTTGIFTVEGGTALIGNTGAIVGYSSSTSDFANTSSGTINLRGGVFRITGPFILGNSTNAKGTSLATFNITGGSADIRNSISIGPGAGFASVTSKIILAGTSASLDLNGFTIGTSGRPVLMQLEAGTLRNVTEINGGNALTKTTAGTLVLEGNNGFSGQLTIAAGTVQIGTGSTSGTIGSGAIVNNAALVFNRSDAYAAANLISGSGTVAVLGGGTILLTGANSYAGLTTVSAGTLAIAHATALGGLGAGTTVADGAALELRGGIAVGAEALSVLGVGPASAGALRNLSGVNSFGGEVTLGGATRIQSLGGTLTLGGTLAAQTFAVTFGGAGNVVLGGALTGTSASLVKDGLGKLTLAGANTFDGTIVINAGTLSVAHADALGTIIGDTTVTPGAALEFQGNVSVLGEVVTLGGTGLGETGVLRNLSGVNAFNGTTTLSAAARIQSDAGTLTLGGATAIIAGANGLDFGGAGNVTVTGIIAGIGASLTKNGGGTLTLSGANTFDAGTTVTAGSLVLGAAGVLLDASALIVDGGTFNIASFDETVNTVSLRSGTIAGSTGSLTSTQPFDLRLGTVSAILAGSANVVKSTTGTVTLAGANSFTSQLQINAGTVAFTQGVQLGAGTVLVDGGNLAYTATGTQASPVSTTAAQNLTIGPAGGTFQVANRFASLNLSGSVGSAVAANLTKTGLGKVAIAGSVNLNGGVVTVSQGALGAGFAIGGVSALNVANGATLNLYDGAAVSLGSTTLTLANGAALGFDLGLTVGTQDSISVAAGSVLGNTITVNLNGLGAVNVGSYTILTATANDLANTIWLLGSAPSGLNYKFTATSTALTVNASEVINRYFNGTTGASWNTPASWSVDEFGVTSATSVPAVTDTLTFSTANAVGPAIATTLDAALSVDSLIFTSVPAGVTSFTIAPGSGGSLSLIPGSSNNGIEVKANAGAITLSAPLAVGGIQTWRIDGTGANGSSLTLSGGVNFIAPVTKLGAGALTLSGTGTGAASFNLADGVLNIGSAGALGFGQFQLGSGVTVRNVAGTAVTLANANEMVWKQGFTVSGNNLSFGAGAVTLTEDITFNADSLTLTDASINSNVRVILPVGGTAVLSAGMPVTGANIPFGAKIASVANNSAFLLTNATTATATAQTLTAYPTYAVDGVISDAGSAYSLIKTGAGFLALGGLNTFGGAGKTVDIQGGLLSVNSNAALGDAANTVTISANGNVNTGFRATESFTSGRTFNLNAVDNAFTVTAGKTLTLSTPFALGALTNKLFKNEAGTLVLSADNTGWTGGLTINGGVVRLTHALAAGTGPISIAPNSAAIGTVLQLQGGLTLTNAITLQGTASQLQGGVGSFGGQLQGLTGINIITGQLNLPYGAVIGAAAGSTLRIQGGIFNSIGNNSLRLDAEGDIVLSETEMSVSAGTSFANVEKFGAGTLRLPSSNSTQVIDPNSDGLIIRQGTVLIDENGSWRSRIFLDVGSTLRLDNTNVNVSAGRLSAAGVYRNLTLRGGNIDLRGGVLSGATTENFNDVTFGKGFSMISVKLQNELFNATTLWFRGAAWGNNAPNQTASAPGTSLLFRGVGGLPSSTLTQVRFTTNPALSGEGGGNGTTNRGIMPWAVVDKNYSGAYTTNLSFATLGSNYVRWLDAPEYETNPAAFGGTAQGVVTNSNVLLTADPSRVVALNTQRNSLTIEGNAGLALGNGVQFSLRSGGILVRPGSISTITGGVINQVAASTAALHVWAFGDLTISSALAGGNGVGSGSPSLIKAGEGTLTIDPPRSAISGLEVFGTNTMSGLFMLNQGTVKLGSNNAFQTNNYFSAIGGTLDLNGFTQFFGGAFTESVVTDQGTNITSTGGAGHILINSDNNARQFAARATGNVSLTRSGQNTLNFYSNSTHTGATTLNGGTVVMYDDAAFSGTSALNINSALLYLDNKSSRFGSLNRIADTATVNLRGGFFELRGREQSVSSEALGTVNLLSGGSQFISVESGVADSLVSLNIGDLVRTPGSVVNFTAELTNRITLGAINGVATTAPATLTNGILGGWAVMGTPNTGTHHFASYSPVYGVGSMGTTGFPAYSNATTDAGTLLAATATSNISLDSATAFTHPVANDLTLNSLRFANQASQTIALAAGKTLTVGTGGLMFFSTAQQVLGSVSNQGSLTSGGAELFAYAQGAAWHIIRTNIVNPSAGVDMALVKSGPGTFWMENANTYTGGTFINNGILVVTPNGGGGVIPLATDVTKGLVVNGSWANAGQLLTYRSGAINPGNEVTINDNGSVILSGDNTLRKVTFNNRGSNGTGYIRTFANNQVSGAGSRGVLTIGVGGLAATSANIATTPFIEGRVDFGAAANTIDVASISVGGFTDVDPLRPTLALQSIVGSAGGITKTGNGVLDFRAQSFFGSDFTVAAGGIRTGVTNSGSRLSTLVLNSGARFDLNNLNTTWGGLAGSGDVFSALGTPTLNVGFNDANTTFAGRFMRFNDASFPLINKIGAGTLTLTAAQPSTGSFGALSVSGGALTYSGAGKAFVSSLAAGSTFNVNTGGTLRLDNAGTNLDNRLGTAVGGRVNLQGGLLALGGSAAGATTEGIALLAVLNGGGRIDLTPHSGSALTLNIGGLAYANASLSATTTNASPNLTGLTSTQGLIPGMQVFGAGIPAGATILRIEDSTSLVLSANATAAGSITVNVVQTAGSLVFTGLSAVSGAGNANLIVTDLNFSGLQGGGANGTTTKSVRGDILVDETLAGPGTGFLTRDSVNGFGRALTSAETTQLINTMGDTFNASVNALTTITAPTTVNTLTTSGTSSIVSGLASTVFGKYGPSGELLSLTLANAAGILVKDGTLTFDMGTLVGPSTGAATFHVLPGATLKVNASLIPAVTGGFTLDNGGTMELKAQTGFFTGTVAINNGTLRLNSGLDFTLATSAGTTGVGLPVVALNGAGAVLDIGAKNQAVRSLSSSNPLPGMGGTVTGLAGSSFGTGDASTFAGRITGGLNFFRAGNSTTTLTAASDYSGETAVLGGTLQLIDGGSIASTAGVLLAQGTLTLNNFGLNSTGNPTRLNPANPVTMAGGAVTFIGGGSADNELTLNQVTLALGNNQINSNPYISMGATNRINLGNLVLATTDVRPTMNFNGWTTLNSGGINTLGGQGLTNNSNIFLTQLNGTAFSSANLVNGLIGGWAVADGSTFATYSNTFGVVAMGQQYSLGVGYPAPNYTVGDINTNNPVGNFNDGAETRTITGQRDANSWRFSAGTNQTFSFVTAPITLGVGIITNNGNTITLQGDSSASSLTSTGTDLYVYTNQGTMNLGMTLTGASMNFVKSGGGNLVLRAASTAGLEHLRRRDVRQPRRALPRLGHGVSDDPRKPRHRRISQCGQHLCPDARQ